VAAWLEHVTPAFDQQLDALATEVARGKRRRRTTTGNSAAPASRTGRRTASGA
jgi:hypothetical protein